MSSPHRLWCHLSSPTMRTLSLPPSRTSGARHPRSGTKRPDRTPCPAGGCDPVPIPAIAATDEVVRLGYESLLAFILMVTGDSILALFLATSPRIREIRSVTLQKHWGGGGLGWAGQWGAWLERELGLDAGDAHLKGLDLNARGCIMCRKQELMEMEVIPSPLISRGASSYTVRVLFESFTMSQCLDDATHVSNAAAKHPGNNHHHHSQKQLQPQSWRGPLLGV